METGGAEYENSNAYDGSTSADAAIEDLQKAGFLVIAHSATPPQLAKTLQEFKGVGPVIAEIFIREIRPLWNEFKLEETKRIGRQSMNRKPRQISPKQAPNQNRRTTRKVAALPKGAKEVLRKGAKGKVIALSPSQPHSKTFGR
jgi:hypothetical protein